MNQLIAGGAAFVLVLVLWGFGRRPTKTILSSTDAGMVAAINRAQLGLVDGGSDDGLPASEPIGSDAGNPSSEPPSTSPSCARLMAATMPASVLLRIVLVGRRPNPHKTRTKTNAAPPAMS